MFIAQAAIKYRTVTLVMVRLAAETSGSTGLSCFLKYHTTLSMTLSVRLRCPDSMLDR